MKKRLRSIGIIFGIIVALVIAGGVYQKSKFPYGWSHCCIIIMQQMLEQYSTEHTGHFPTGGTSPEASLSLLCQSNNLDAYTIRGMTVPEDTARKILDAGGLLGPDSCGWHYTDGLTLADDPRIALLYCKQALGHNGQKTPDGGRQVVFVGGNIRWISGSNWPSFLEEQNELLSKRSDRAKSGTPLVSATIQLPDGREIESVDGSYKITHQSAGSGSSGSGEESGGNLSRDDLVWFQAPTENGLETRTVSFSNLISAPVTVTFTNGVPDKTNVVFKMRPRE
jgi:hypothetical protein